MHLGFHGGKCCGIKVIWGFGHYPNELEDALSAISESNKDAHGEHVASTERFFTEEAPQETKLARLDRYLEYCDARRPCGCVEVTLADYDGDGQGQLTPWRGLLEERGFKLVSQFANSNSDNDVYVFHRISFDESGLDRDHDDDYDDDPDLP